MYSDMSFVCALWLLQLQPRHPILGRSIPLWRGAPKKKFFNFNFELIASIKFMWQENKIAHNTDTNNDNKQM